MLPYIIDGGLIMLLLVALSIVAVAVIIDRWRVFKRAEVDTPRLRESVKSSLERGKVEEAESACGRIAGPAASVLLVGLRQYGVMRVKNRSGRDLVENVSRSMGDYAPQVLDLLERRLNILSMIGSIAPLLGMTGTVVGMMISFNEMAAAGGLDGGAVAGGISMALTTTAAGLLIAIPSVVFHNYFSRRIEGFTLEIEASANTLIDHISLNHD